MTDRPLNPERTPMLGSIIAAQLGTLADLNSTSPSRRKTCSPEAVYAERRQSLAPNDVELGGIREPPTPVPPNQLPSSSSSSSSGRAPALMEALSTSSCASASCPTIVSDPTLPASEVGAVSGSSGMYGLYETPVVLDTLGRTIYPLFCVNVHENAWMAAGYGVWAMET